MRKFTILAAALAIGGAAAADPPAPPAEPGTDTIRLSADGAGPSHLFRLTGDRGSDVIGVVDPLFAAIRLYRVRRAAAPGEALDRRLGLLGACALPVDFRPWRIRHEKRRVLIESMPDPGALGHAAPVSAMRTRVLAVPRSLLEREKGLAAAAEHIDSSDWDPAEAPQCGTLLGKPGRVGARGPGHARRRDNRTILLTTRLGTIAVHSKRYRLIGAHELEPTARLRIVEAAEAVPGADGMIRIRSRLLAYSRRTGRLVRAITVDDATLRGKLGLAPVAALPSGELLVMGKAPGSAQPFRILSCGIADGALSGGLCREDEPSAIAEAPARPIPRPAPPHAQLGAAAIFANVARLVSYRLEVDTRAMPEACRRAEGCRVAGERANFVPIRGIRLTRGVFRRTGAPYAQARVPEDIDRLYAASPGQLAHALERVRSGARDLPGNIADGLGGDLGVDCSGLVQVAWGGRAGARLDTASLQALRSPLACSSRLPGPDYLRPGDAIGLRIDSPVHMVNHVVLYAATMRLDGASDSWLVLESSSACDGVCWSVYDPARFDGWGLYRAGGRRDAACFASEGAATPIPYDLTRWTARIGSR